MKRFFIIIFFAIAQIQSIMGIEPKTIDFEIVEPDIKLQACLDKIYADLNKHGYSDELSDGMIIVLVLVPENCCFTPQGYESLATNIITRKMADKFFPYKMNYKGVSVYFRAYGSDDLNDYDNIKRITLEPQNPKVESITFNFESIHDESMTDVQHIKIVLGVSFKCFENGEYELNYDGIVYILQRLIYEPHTV